MQPTEISIWDVWTGDRCLSKQKGTGSHRFMLFLLSSVKSNTKLMWLLLLESGSWLVSFRYWNVWFLPRVQVQSFVWIMSYKVFSSSLSWAGELLFSLHPEGSCGTSGQIFRVFLFIKSLKSLGANPKDFTFGCWKLTDCGILRSCTSSAFQLNQEYLVSNK